MSVLALDFSKLGASAYVDPLTEGSYNVRAYLSENLRCKGSSVIQQKRHISDNL